MLMFKNFALRNFWMSPNYQLVHLNTRILNSTSFNTVKIYVNPSASKNECGWSLINTNGRTTGNENMNIVFSGTNFEHASSIKQLSATMDLFTKNKCYVFPHSLN